VIIFTTAHDSFALQAFDTNALDYLVKPIDPVRLARAVSKLARFQSHLARFGETPEPNNDNTLPATAMFNVGNDDEEQELQLRTAPEIAPHERLQEESRLVIKEGERYWFITVGDIRFLESEGNYTRVFFGKNKPLMPRSLAHLEERLDPHLFFRASRKHIVNIRAIQGVEAWHHGGLMLQMSCGTHIEMSRRQALRFKEIMMI
jgi:two-component system LytT family response regulator